MARKIIRNPPAPPADPLPAPSKVQTRAPSKRSSTKKTPPPIEHVDKHTLQQVGEFISVSVDTGVYLWLREIIEAKSRIGMWNGWRKDLIERAMTQFKMTEPEAPPPPPVRRVVRRKG